MTFLLFLPNHIKTIKWLKKLQFQLKEYLKQSTQLILNAVMRRTKISLQISVLGNLSTNMQLAKC